MQYLLFKNQFTFAHFRLIKKGKTEDCCVLRNFKEHVDDRKLQAILLINITQFGGFKKTCICIGKVRVIVMIHDCISNISCQ